MSTRTVERARAGQPIGTVARDKLTRYTLRRASTQLRAAGVANVHAMTPHTILATYLDRHLRHCACGCGQQLTGRHRKYLSDAHRQAHERRIGKRKPTAGR